jgi:hypothetical protein
MKSIPLRAVDGGVYTSRNVIAQVANLSPSRPISVDEMRRRVRILDALEKADDTLLLEDADHAILKAAVEAFPFNVADAGLLRIVDDILEAGEPAAPR